MADQRLLAVYDAASYLFIAKGYTNTQVSQIAYQANVATGTIYNLFTGKKSILHFVLLATLNKDYLQGELTVPVQEVDDHVIVEQLSTIVDALFAEIDGEPTFTALFSTLFDYTASYQVAFNIVNDNPSVLATVEEKYKQAVGHLYAVIGTNIARYIKQGEMRPIEMPRLHIRNIIEVIIWWSMYLPYQETALAVPVSQAKHIALDILQHAYLQKPTQSGATVS